MTFKLYWGRKLLKNAGLSSGDKITLSVESFRLELEKAYRAGQEEGRPSWGGSGSSSLDDLLHGFGRK